MQLNRRRLLAGVASAAVATALPAAAQVLTGGGRMLTGGGRALMRPPIPAVAGGLLDTQITMNNPAGQPTQTNPYFSMGMPIAQGGFPATGYKLALYDSTGVTKITDLQVDQRVSGWKADLSQSYCVISGYATGTTLTAGSTATFRVKAEAGTPPATPFSTLAALTSSTDMKAVCKIGTDTYTVSFNNIVSLYSGAPSANPQGLFKLWKSGPYVQEYAGGQYLKRDSDGASHKWAFLKLYFSFISTGQVIVRGLLENIQSFGPNSVGTIGINATSAGIEIVDSIDLYNGASLIGSMGGANDNRKGTFAPANVNTTTGELTVSFATGNIPYYSPIGFASSGALPGGLGAATSTTYWLTNGHTTGTVIPCITRWWSAHFLSGSCVFTATVVSGTSYPVNRYCTVNGGYWVVTTAGVSTGTLPSGAGPTFVDNGSGGTLVWTLVTAQITSQGTGTHSLLTKASLTRASKAPIMGSDTYPFWSGSGALPKLLCGYDFNYLTTKTKSVPPLDPTITAGAWRGPVVVYNQNVVYLPGDPSLIDIGPGSEGSQDERVNPFPNASASSIYLPNDLGLNMAARYVALSFMDRQGYFYRDETTQQILATDYGPDRLGGSYPGLGVTRPNSHYHVTADMTSINSAPPQWPGYGGDYFSVGFPEASHNPNPFYYEYIRSGDPLFFDPMLEYAAAMWGADGTGQHIKSAVIGGVRYSCAFPLYQQARGAGWEFKIVSQAEWLIPDGHLAKPFLSNVMDDSAVFGLLWCRANLGAVAQSVGYLPMVYPSLIGGGGQAQAIEPWMHAYLVYMLSWEAWKGNRPGFKAFLETYYLKMYLDLFDDDLGGSILAVDSQFTLVGTVNGGPNPPTEATVIVPVRDRYKLLAAEIATWPPPGPKFVKGLATAAPGQTNYVYWTGNVLVDPVSAFQTQSYGLVARAVMIMGTAAGLTQPTKLLPRMEAVIAAQYGGHGPATWVAPASGGGQPAAVPKGNPNGLMWAIAVPT